MGGKPRGGLYRRGKSATPPPHHHRIPVLTLAKDQPAREGKMGSLNCERKDKKPR